MRDRASTFATEGKRARRFLSLLRSNSATSPLSLSFPLRAAGGAEEALEPSSRLCFTAVSRLCHGSPARCLRFARKGQIWRGGGRKKLEEMKLNASSSPPLTFLSFSLSLSFFLLNEKKRRCRPRREDLQDQVRAVPRRREGRRPQAGECEEELKRRENE